MQHKDRRSCAWQSKKAIVLDCNNQSCHNNHQLIWLTHEIFDDTKRQQQVRFRRPLSRTIRYKWFKKTAGESITNISKNHQNIWNYKRKHECCFNITKHLKFQFRTSNIMFSSDTIVFCYKNRVPAFIWYVQWELLPLSMETDLTSIGCEMVMFYITDWLILLW